MTNHSVNKFNKYFAAANSYGGFVSFFDEIFDPRNYDRIFILKGGPGTGKNSFMRKIKQYFADQEHSVDEIYCSSDSGSLDGIIIKNENGRIAIIDGTAPHERDTRIPGATDEIINLGENWDKRWLVAQKQKIILLSDEKRKAYSTAYDYLKIGKNAFDFIKKTHSESFEYKNAEKTARKILKEAKKSSKFRTEYRLLSAFGKDGLVTLVPQNNSTENRLNVGGDFIDFLLLIDSFAKVLREKEISHFISPYPLSPELYEAIYIPEIDMLISFEKENISLDTSVFSRNRSKTYTERIIKAKTILKDSEEEAVRWFKIASEFHFRLEDVYSKAMCFEKNDNMLENVISEIKTIFNK